MIKKFRIYIYSSLFAIVFFLSFSNPLFAIEETKESCEKLIKEATEKLTNNKNYTRSLELFTEVQVISDKNKWDKELFVAQTGIGIIYSEVLKDTLLMGISAINLSVFYNKMGQVEQASDYIQISIDLTNDNKQHLLHTQVSQIENLFLRNKNTEAKLIDGELMPDIQGIQNKEHHINTYLTLSKIYDHKPELLTSSFAKFACRRCDTGKLRKAVGRYKRWTYSAFFVRENEKYN